MERESDDDRRGEINPTLHNALSGFLERLAEPRAGLAFTHVWNLAGRPVLLHRLAKLQQLRLLKAKLCNGAHEPF